MVDKDDSLYDDVAAMADRIGLTGSDRTRYIHNHMTRSGYKAVPQYVRSNDDDDDDDGDEFFGSSGRRRRSDAGSRRDDSGGRSQRRRRRGADDDDEWYG